MFNKQESFINDKSTLFLVATPIGNLDELTPRAIQTLKEVSIIACEDTRNTIKLLSHLDIKTKLIAYHNFNEEASSEGIIKLMEQGNNIALVSDAGYPLVQDPGISIVNKCIDKGYNVVPISGANASINALVSSGLKVEPHLFYGFLKSNNNQLEKELESLKELPYTIIFYESVHRINKTLESLLKVLGDRKMCLCRELTKKYETFYRGTISEVINNFNDNKGEFVIIVEGYQQIDDENDRIEKAINEINEDIKQGISKSDAIKSACKKYNIKKNSVYNLVH